MHTEIIDFLSSNFPNYEGLKPITGGGSDREYFRFQHNNQSYILTKSNNIKENESFFYFTEVFQRIGLNVPKILAIHKNQTIYVQSDLGNKTLLNCLQENRESAFTYYEKSLKQLVKMQIKADSVLDYQQCYDYQVFDKMLVLRDLFYFKDYFLDLLPISYSNQLLFKDFEKLSTQIENIEYQLFMFRDFQTRNIMIHQKQPYFIDYQGGMKGAIQYDLVSLLWQAKADLSDNWKNQLYNVYLMELKQTFPKLDQESFKRGYKLCIIERLLQVLGAYGFRGLYEKKPHFIESISFGLKNLERILSFEILDEFPAIQEIIEQLIQPKTKQTIENIINGTEIKR